MNFFNLLIILAIVAIVLYTGIYQAADLPPSDPFPVGGTLGIVLSVVIVYIAIRVTYNVFGSLVSRSADIGTDIAERLGNRIVGGKWE